MKNGNPVVESARPQGAATSIKRIMRASRNTGRPMGGKSFAVETSRCAGFT